MGCRSARDATALVLLQFAKLVLTLKPVETNGESTPLSGKAKRNSKLRPAWKPGQSGNPAGRPKGVRHKLANAFLEGLQAELMRRGPIVFEELEAKDLVATLAKVMPQNFELSTDPDNPPRLVIEWKNSE